MCAITRPATVCLLYTSNGIDLPLERFYDMLAAADKLPTTSQPGPELFLSHFLAAKAAGDTCLLYTSRCV